MICRVVTLLLTLRGEAFGETAGVLDLEMTLQRHI